MIVRGAFLFSADDFHGYPLFGVVLSLERWRGLGTAAVEVKGAKERWAEVKKQAKRSVN
jgi:hypothetical protein